jgi:hypothetical protein
MGLLKTAGLSPFLPDLLVGVPSCPIAAILKASRHIFEIIATIANLDRDDHARSSLDFVRSMR